MTPRLIAFAGPIGSGKTYASKHLETKGFTRLSFADPLREMLLKLDPWLPLHGGNGDRLSTVINWCGWDRVKTSPHGPEVRRLLQTLGNEIIRKEVGCDFLMFLTAWRLREHGWHASETGRCSIVIDDARFKNEARQVKEFGGTVVYIERSGTPAGDHVSEKFDPAWADLRVTNCGTAEFLNTVEGLLL